MRIRTTNDKGRTCVLPLSAAGSFSRRRTDAGQVSDSTNTSSRFLRSDGSSASTSTSRNAAVAISTAESGRVKNTLASPSDFRQITPAKPKQPPASNSHSGLSRVAKASAAATAVTRAPAQVRSAVCAKIRPLAPINPIESGTRAV
jgi:hypothetical protein